MTIASPPGGLPNNLLTVTDSDFETGSTTWVAETNASSVAVTTAHPFTGTHSLSWSATAGGDTFVMTGFYPCLPSEGYDVSGYVNTVTATHDVSIGVNWYTSSHTLISSVFGNPNTSTTVNGFQPIVAALTSPSNAAFFKVVVWAANGVLAAEVFAIDLLYAAQVQAQVLVDWYNPAFQPGTMAGNSFIDITPWVRLDQNITMTHGRQDAVSEIQAGQAYFVAENDAGWFTPQRATSPYFPNVSFGARTQINATDQLGVWYTRFDGAISEITYSVDPTGNTNLATFSCSDVLAMMNRQDPLQSWTKQTILGNGPALHWTLNDSPAAGVGAESSGNNGPMLRLLGNQTGGQVATATWQSSNGGIETLANAAAAAQSDGSAFWQPGSDIPTSLVRGLGSGTVGPASTPLPTIYFSPALTAQTAQNLFLGTDGYQLQAQLLTNGVPAPINPNTINGNYAIEAWFAMDPGVKANLGRNLGPFTVLSLGSSRQASCLVAGLYYSGPSTLNFEVATYAQPPAFSMTSFTTSPTIVASVSAATTADAVPRPHHLVLNILGVASGAASADVYLDGVMIGNLTLPAGVVFDTICIGGAFGGHGNFFGNISCVSVYQFNLSPAQITTDCSVGQYGMWEQPTDNCIAVLGTYGGIPSFWSDLSAQNNGLSLTDYFDITGSTPVTSMQIYEQAERGLLFVSSEGQLTFHTRDWRMGYGAPDLSIPADVYGSDLGYELIDTFLLNEAATATTVFPTGVAWTAQGSRNAFGSYANGTLNSPVQLPLITWSRGYSVMGLAPFVFWADPNLNDNSSWQVNTRSQPRLIPGQMTVDLLTLDALSGLTIASFYALDIDMMITLPGLSALTSFPDQAGAADFFIEGVNELIGQQSRTLTYYTSPASAQRAWIPGDATYGQLGTTTRIGISAPDVSIPPALGKTVGHDGGPPFWPPSFSTLPNAYQIGFANVASALTAVTSVSVQSSQGDCILVQVLAAASTTVTVTDTQSNTYTQLGSVTLSGGQKQYLFACFNAQALSPQATDTITVTGLLTQAYVTSAYDISGVSAIDGTAHTATATSAAPAVTLGTLAAANEVELVVVSNVTNKTTSIPAGWTQFGYNFFSSTYENQMFWRQAPSTTGDTFTSTLSGSTAWGALGIALTLEPFSMNNPAGNGHQFVGATEIRGLRDTTALMLNPPLLVVGMVNHQISYTTGNQGVNNHSTWDTIYVDTQGGMGIEPSWPNWYVVTIPGFYEICASFPWASQGAGAVGVRTAWIVVAQAAAQKLAAGTGSPLTDNYVSPVGEQVPPNNASRNAVDCPTTRIYLGVGDMINLGVMQTQGSSQNNSNLYSGPIMSARWLGYNTAHDQTPICGAPGTGGVVTPSTVRTTYIRSWTATSTFSYYGTGSGNSPQLRNTNNNLFQSQYTPSTGSQFAFAVFNYTAIAAALSGATINSVKITLQNVSSGYGTGVSVMLGYCTSTTFGSSFTPAGGTHFNLTQQWFKKGQTLTFDVTGAGIGTAFQSGSATSLAIGDNHNHSLQYYGFWTGLGGGTAPVITINFTK